MTINRHLLNAIVETATAWCDPFHTTRLNAVEQALEVAGRFTEESLAFAVNHYMSSLRVVTSEQWSGLLNPPNSSRSIVLIHQGTAPLEELYLWVIITSMGHLCTGMYESTPPVLLLSFAKEVAQKTQNEPFRWVSKHDSLNEDSVVIEVSNSPWELVEEHCRRESEYGGSDCYLSERRFSIAILSGNESKQERLDLAEDVLLYEGMGENNVRIIWAPAELNPDPYLEAFAFFRSVFPVHERTAGSLQMRKAFLAAYDQPHAYGEGLEFLVSKGDAECQEPCHIRWAPYKSLSEFHAWLRKNERKVQYIVATHEIERTLDTSIRILPFGMTHRQGVLDSRRVNEVSSFLAKY